MKKPNKKTDVFSEEQKQTIAKTLVNLRELGFYSQTDIAHHLHLSSSAISHYEKGITVPPTEIIFRLAEFYNVTADSIRGLPRHSTWQGVGVANPPFSRGLKPLLNGKCLPPP